MEESYLPEIARIEFQLKPKQPWKFEIKTETPWELCSQHTYYMQKKKKKETNTSSLTIYRT